jgi:hypothetical protein
MKAHCEMIDACLPPYGLHFSGRFEHWVTICGWVIFYQLRILWVFCDGSLRPLNAFLGFLCIQGNEMISYQTPSFNTSTESIYIADSRLIKVLQTKNILLTKFGDHCFKQLPWS